MSKTKEESKTKESQTAISLKEKFLDEILIEGFSTCITSDPGCRGGNFSQKRKL